MNIIFLAYESEAIPLARLARRFKDKGHGVLVVSCDHYNVTHGRSEVARFCASIGIDNSEYKNLAGVYHELNALPEALPEDAVDWDYLRNFEKRNCNKFSLLEIIAMDPLLSRAYHHRDIYYHPANKTLLFKSIELQAKWLEDIFHRMDFDAVVTLNYQYFLKALAYDIAEAKKIPFYAIANCRIGKLHLVYDNFSQGTPGFIVEEMRRLQDRRDPCRDALEFMESMRFARQPAWLNLDAWKQEIAETLSIRGRLREIWRLVKRVRHIPRDTRYLGMFRYGYFLPSYFAMLRVLTVNLCRMIGYFRHPELVRRDLPHAPFVFFPLHVIPESTVLTLSRTYDEMECVFQLSKSIPIDWKIVVKVNIGMLGSYDTHPNRYYLDMAALPNVQFIHPSMPSPDIIARACAVACICGTALLEAAVFGKPAIRWGNPEFDVIDTVHEFDSRKLSVHFEQRVSDNVTQYIQACFNLGLELDMSLLEKILLPFGEQAEYERQLGILESRILDLLVVEDVA